MWKYNFRQWIGGDITNQYLWWKTPVGAGQTSWMESKSLSEVHNNWWKRYCIKMNVIPLSENAKVKNRDEILSLCFLHECRVL